METSNFGKTSLSCQYDEISYNDPQKQTVGFSFIFSSNRPFFKLLWIDIFSSYLMLRIFGTFLGYQLQHELP